MTALASRARAAAAGALRSLAVVAVVASAAGAQQRPKSSAPSRPAVPVSPPTADSLRGIEARGRELALYDSAAWHGSDAVMTLHPDKRLASRYVARRTADGTWEVAFGALTPTRDTFLVRYRAVSAPDAPDRFRGEALASPAADTGFYARAARAIELATRDFGPTTRPYNVAALPAPGGAWWVYLLPAQTRSNVYPLGGDARYTISPDGNSVVVKRQLHRTVLEFGAEPSGRSGDALEGAFHVAILDNVPEDTDVFHVLAREPKLPHYIATEAFVYRIDPDGTINLMGRREDVLGK
jgi:hypothetical protein